MRVRTVASLYEGEHLPEYAVVQTASVETHLDQDGAADPVVTVYLRQYADGAARAVDHCAKTTELGKGG